MSRIALALLTCVLVVASNKSLLAASMTTGFSNLTGQARRQVPEQRQYQVPKALSEQRAKRPPLADMLIETVQQRLDAVKALGSERSELSKNLRLNDDEIFSTKTELETTKKSKPEQTSKWSKLEIGEFEKASDFESRRDFAKTTEENHFKNAIIAWNAKMIETEQECTKKIEVLSLRKNKLAERLAGQEAKIAMLEKKPLALPELPVILTCKEVHLPRFNRNQMRFGPITVKPFESVQIESSKAKNLIASIEASNGESFDIKFDKLEEAEEFKKQFEQGKINIVYHVKFVFGNIESPIILKREVSQEKEALATRGNLGKMLGALTLGALASAAGASPDQMKDVGGAIANHPDLEIKPEKKKVILQAEKKIEGVRYHFTTQTEYVKLVDKEQNTYSNGVVNLRR